MSPSKYIKLSEIKDKDLTYIRNLSRDLRTGNGNIKLDCTDVYGMEDDKLKALISDLPNEWKRKQECDEWINTDTLTLDFRRRLHEYLEKQKEEQEQEGDEDEESTPPPLPPPTPWKIIVLLGTISVLSTIIPIISYLRAPKVKTNKIVLGVVNDSKKYKEIEQYLEKTIKPENPIEFFKGQKIDVEINQQKLYGRAMGKIKSYVWDVAFSYSPVISMAAQDAGYEYIANMFPDSPTYESVIFARSDSPVSLLSDLYPANSIALGDYFSASKFYAPLYRLYGLSLKVELDKKPKEIYKSVISGQVTLGVAANDPEYFKSNDPKIKLIPDNGQSPSQLPSSTVSLSPNLTENDRKVLKDVLLNAPKEFRDIDHANFGKVPDKYLPNYEEFRDTISRVREVTACANFLVNPVSLYCNSNQKILLLKGVITGTSIDFKKEPDQKLSEYYTLLVEQIDGKRCQVSVDKKIIKLVVDFKKLIDLQGQMIEAYLGVNKDAQCQETTVFPIYQPNQLQIFQKKNIR